MDILYALLYVVAAALLAIFVMWVLRSLLGAFKPPVDMGRNVMLLIGVFLFIIFVIILFNRLPLHAFKI